jgi:hypothetical protein
MDEKGDPAVAGTNQSLEEHETAPEHTVDEKTTPAAPKVDTNPDASSDRSSSHLVFLPRGWKYLQPPGRLLRMIFPWYASPKVQLGMVSLVCFLCPGMFNALGGLGGGGKKDATLGDNMVNSNLTGWISMANHDLEHCCLLNLCRIWLHGW